MLKFRCETSIRYESRKCMQAVQGFLPEVIRVLQSNINIFCFPQPTTPHLSVKLCLKAGRAGTWEWAAPNYTVCTVQYHSLSGTVSFLLQRSYTSTTSQARPNCVLGQRSICEMFLVCAKDRTGKKKNFRAVWKTETKMSMKRFCLFGTILPEQDCIQFAFFWFIMFLWKNLPFFRASYKLQNHLDARK